MISVTINIYYIQYTYITVAVSSFYIYFLNVSTYLKIGLDLSTTLKRENETASWHSPVRRDYKSVGENERMKIWEAQKNYSVIYLWPIVFQERQKCKCIIIWLVQISMFHYLCVCVCEAGGIVRRNMILSHKTHNFPEIRHYPWLQQRLLFAEVL
jgi:hypothetical protein